MFGVCRDWMFVLPLQVNVPKLHPSSATVSEYRALIEVIKVNIVVSVGPWSQRILLYRKKREQSTIFLRVHTPRKDPVSTSEKHWSTTESSPGTSHAVTLILGFQTPGLWESKFPLFKSLTLWYFVVVAWADWYYIFETKTACRREQWLFLL